MIRTAFLLCLALAPLQTRADDLLTIYRQVIDSDPTLKAAEAGYQAVLLGKDKAIAILLPTANLSANTSKNQQVSSISLKPGKLNYNNTGYTLSISQPVFHYDAFVQNRQATLSIQKSAAELATAQQDLIIRAAENYFNLLSAQASLEFARSEKKATAKQLEQAQKRFEVGLIAITDVYEAKSAYDLVVASEITARNQLDSAGEALSEITGIINNPLAKLDTNIPLQKPDPANMNEWTKIALKQNLQLKATKAAVEISKENISLQRSGHYPTLDIVASRNKSDTGGDFGRNSTTDSVTLQLNVPLFQGGLVNAQTKEAAYLYSQAKHNLDKQLRATMRQTRDAYRGVISGISQVRALKQATISTKSALETTQAGFDVGTRNIVDVLLAQRNLFRSKRDYDQALHQYVLNVLRLKFSAGTLSPDDLKYFNAWLK
ncbi:MAG TPA: type I secretion protein TolC [Gammaproteobacteria bacterium]|nr:type I secretion protein TolC [Gammaproteobacteria bacterium]